MPPFADVLQWEHLPFPKSLRDFQRLFKDDDACARYLEGAKWPKGFECPHCHQTWGNAVAVDHRYIADIVQGIIADGLTVD